MNVLELGPLLAYPALVGVVIALTQAIKRVVPDTRWHALIAVGLGIGWTAALSVVAYGPESLPDGLVAGVGVGLAAAGLYDVGKSVRPGEADDSKAVALE